MGRNIKCKPDHLSIAIFTLCLSVRFVEYFLIETDKTAIGENVLHKVAGIIILALVLKSVNLSWSDIGFLRNGFVSGILKGLLLGSVCFVVSFGLELGILSLHGNPAHLEIYIGSFSLTGSQIKNTEFVFFLLCILFNIVNVWMEEGVFRGLFIKTLSETKPFMAANFFAAFLFGIWHIVMPIRSYINGEMSFAEMLLMGIGYMILAGIMGIKWGLLYRITGNLWAGLGDHLFNNTIATNMLHVVSLNGADKLQIVRIMAAQIISFAFVLLIHTYRCYVKRQNGSLDRPGNEKHDLGKG
ncbi:MAG: CPBP family intramembrane metalloprotease [Dorea sp.]|nr:CPBP family intramembrane metalloprotease [Dorea sp.]